MKKGIIINRAYEIGTIEKDMWGSFVEHMGRVVYKGIYDPECGCADERGFREDVKEAVKELSVPKIRYPGGNFLSGYDWKNGIGKNRPVKLDLAWGQIEPNKVGLHEFCEWAEECGSQVMMSVNMGTGTPKDAAEIVEYCNFEKGSEFSDLRRENGREKPFGIKTWCIGNEMDGEWQICGLTADEYGRKAKEAAKMMKWVDPSIELVVCGSSSCVSPTYPEWDRVVLQHTYDYVDYISLHRYITYTPSGRVEDFMSAHVDLDAFINAVCATADYVKTYKKSQKTMKLSLDEWNVWHTAPAPNGLPVYNDSYRERWTIGARRVENTYDLADAITFTGLICTMINHADRVKIGCLAQLVNVIAPIMTEPGGRMFKQTIYYPFQLAIRYAKGTALDLKIFADKMDTDYGAVDKIYAACAYDEGKYSLFVINKSAEEETYDVDFQVNPVHMISRTVMKGNVHDYNDFDHPNKILPQEEAIEKGTKTSFAVKLPAYSFTLIRFEE